jgi:hypothetical protein
MTEYRDTPAAKPSLAESEQTGPSSQLSFKEEVRQEMLRIYGPILKRFSKTQLLAFFVLKKVVWVVAAMYFVNQN